MAQYTFPSITANSSRMELASNTKSFVSPLTGATQTLSRGGSRWFLELMFRNLVAGDRAELMGFIALLDGKLHRANIADPSYTGKRGSGSATIEVDGAGQSGRTLSVRETSSGTSTVANFLRRGDMLSYLAGNGLYELQMVTSDFNLSGGSGDVSVSPGIRSAPADGAAINLTAPIATYMLVDDQNGRSNAPGNPDGEAFSDFTLRFIQDIAA